VFRRSVRIGALLLCGGAIITAQGAVPTDVIATRVDAMARARMSEKRPASISIAISRRNEVLFQRAYGIADLATNRPATANSLYRLGGASVQFTATLVLKQVERGKLDLNDSIGHHLKTGLRPEWRSLTIEQLLNHTSGLPGSFTWDTPPEEPASTSTLIEWAARDTMRFAAGSRFGYSRVGYLLLAALVEKLYGKPYDTILREEIAGPLGLSSLGWCAEGHDSVEATGYQDVSPNNRRPVPRVHPSKTLGEGGICATAGDLAAWNRALHGKRVLSPTSYAAITTSIKSADRPAVAECCFQVTNDPPFGALFLTLDGGEGFATESAWFPAESLNVTVLYNSFGPGVMGRPFALDLADALAKLLPPKR
jgi:D-alanyl-D-alanine carboxypeptidase